MLYGSKAAKYDCVIFIETKLQLDGFQLLRMGRAKTKTKLWHFCKTWPYHLRTLKISNIWTRPNSVTFRNWIEKTWLPLDKVCFSCSFKIKANLKSKLKF